MFTDQPVTPARLEILLAVLRDRPRMNSGELKALLQPKTLPDVKPNSSQAAETLKAARILGLLSGGEKDDESPRLTFDKSADLRAAVLSAFDERVLGDDSPETYFARFYSFLLDAGSDPRRAGRSRDEWVSDFRAAYPQASEKNPFNKDKITGIRRWLVYAGLGWDDPAGVFQCNPYARVRRRLPAVFAEEKSLDQSAFFAKLGEQCPELDGGRFFVEVVPAGRELRCTVGLADALVELHLDGVIRLRCPTDGDGRSIAAAEPPMVGTIESDRVARVDYLEGGRP